MVPKLPVLTARVILLAVILFPFGANSEAGAWRLQATAPSPSQSASPSPSSTVGPTAPGSTNTPESTIIPASVTGTLLPPPSSTATTPSLLSPSPSPMTPTDEVTSSIVGTSSTTPVATTEPGTATPEPLTATAPSAPSPTPTPASAPTAEGSQPRQIIINEVAWSGTLASAFDEWIELHNPNDSVISLEGWRLTDGGDIDILLFGSINPHGYYLLERTDDTTISSLSADQIYTGSLRNTGEILQLYSSSGDLVDTVNPAGGEWPAGEADSRASMQRIGPATWTTFMGIGSALDRDGNLVPGTPRQMNTSSPPTAQPSPTFTPTDTQTNTATSTPTPTTTPPPPTFPEGSVLINEVAWAGTSASASDEWIELHNTSQQRVDLTGWRLSDGGDIDVLLTGYIAPNGYFLMERTDDTTISDIDADLIYHGSLRNSREQLELFDPLGKRIDSANLDGAGWPAGNANLRSSM